MYNKHIRMESENSLTSFKKLKISRVLHAGYILEYQQEKILFDPIFENPFSVNCYAYPSVIFSVDEIKSLKFSAIFISHFHEDHCSLESLVLLDKQIPIYIFCKSEELPLMIKELGFSQVFILKWDETISIGEFQVTTRKALDEEVDSLFHIQVAGYNILNVVDSWIPEDTLQLLTKQKCWDLILWPFQTMRELEVIAPSRFDVSDRKLPFEWLDQLKQLNPKRIVPSSCQFQMETWSWYNKSFFPISYEIFQKEININLPKTEVIRLDPGRSIEIANGNMQASEALSWIIPVGDQNIDYVYEKDMVPMSLNEIAENLTSTSQSQRERVLNFCQDEIQLRWQELALEEDDYFNNNKSWCLNVYDHDGKIYEFNYKFANSQISLCDSKNEDPSWLTEIPLLKFYGALECGESLTSIYIRINNTRFSNAVEQDIKEVDILSDPLLRVLYHQEAFAYQKAQLKKLYPNREYYRAHYREHR